MKLRIEKAIYGGAGLARMPEGKAAFVPLVLPGELVEAHTTAEHSSYATAALDTVLEASPERVVPGCPYFPTCGGCQYQHAAYEAQVAMKLAILRETLMRAHVTLPDTIETAAAQPWQYRNRIRLHVQAEPEFSLCYREAGSHRNLPVELCPISAPVLVQGLRATVEAIRQSGLDPELFAEVEFFCDGTEDSLLISFFTAKPKEAVAALPELWSRLTRALPAFSGAAVFAASGKSRGEMIGSAGIPSLLYSSIDLTYRVSAGSFFQVNRVLTPELLRLVTEDRSGKLAWDLYAGVGLFAQALARNFQQVVAVEPAPSSSADLRHNLPGKPHRIVTSDTLGFLELETRRKPRPRPDLIVLDPPRAGLGKRVCELIATASAPQVVYVSCDPATLARDLGQLQRFGYRIESMTLVDLFPQTFHLETVAVLARA